MLKYNSSRKVETNALEHPLRCSKVNPIKPSTTRDSKYERAER